MTSSVSCVPISALATSIKRFLAAFLAEIFETFGLDILHVDGGIGRKHRGAFVECVRDEGHVASGIGRRDGGEAEVRVRGVQLFEENDEVLVEALLFLDHGVGVVDNEEDIDGAGRSGPNVLVLSCAE